MIQRHNTVASTLTILLATVLWMVALANRPVLGGETIRVSVSSAGQEADRFSSNPSISADGRYVAFSTQAGNLVPDDTDWWTDVFVHDRQTGETTRVSVSTAGEQGNEDSDHPSVSADGRFVAFHSDADNLVRNDTATWCDVFVHDRETKTTTRVSLPSLGGQSNRGSSHASISGDGRYVAFYSLANNLVPDDTNQAADIFVHGRQTGLMTRVSVSSTDEQSNGLSNEASISGDGRYVVFHSYASNLVETDTNGQEDVFVRDRVAGVTTRVSVPWSGGQSNGHSGAPAISGNGRYVAFYSYADNLVPDDANGCCDVFVYDRQMGETTRVSISATGEEGGDKSSHPSISPDGRYVAFYSAAANLVPHDTTGSIDVFVHDRETGQIERVSVSTCCEPGDNDSDQPRISTGGLYVAFTSLATNLVPDDTNRYGDIFVHETEGVCLCAAADPPGSGSVSRFPDEFCFPFGAAVQLTAHAEGTCSFVVWSGGVPSGHEWNNPLPLTLEASTSVTAHFASSWGGMDADCNANGIPDGCDGEDCNGTGVLDICDINVGTSLDCNENYIPDECEVLDAGDFNADGVVNLEDFAALLPCLAGPNHRPHPLDPGCVGACLDAFDSDDDGDVDQIDVAAFELEFTGQ